MFPSDFNILRLESYKPTEGCLTWQCFAKWPLSCRRVLPLVSGEEAVLGFLCSKWSKLYCRPNRHQVRQNFTSRLRMRTALLTQRDCPDTGSQRTNSRGGESTPHLTHRPRGKLHTALAEWRPSRSLIPKVWKKPCWRIMKTNQPTVSQQLLLFYHCRTSDILSR